MTERFRTYLKHFSWLSVGDFISKTSIIWVVSLLARSVSQEEFGLFHFLFSLIGILTIFADAGVARVFVREGSRNKDRLRIIFAHFIRLKSISTLLFVGLILVSPFVLQMTPLTRSYFYLYSVFGLCETIMNFSFSYFRIYEKFYLESAIRSFNRLLLAVGATLLFFVFPDAFSLWNVYILYVIAGSAGVIATFTVIRSVQKRDTLRSAVRIDRELLKSYARESMLLGFSALFWQIYYRIDSVLLQYLRNSVEVAIYGAAYSVFQLVNTIPILLMSSAYPRLSSLYAEDRNRFRVELRGLLFSVAAVSVVTVLVGIAVSGVVIQLAFGDAYRASVPVLQLLLVSFLFLFMGHVVSTALIAMNRIWMLTLISLCGCVLNVALNLMVIPSYGYSGAAAVTVATEAFVAITAGVLVWKQLKQSSYVVA